MTLSIVLTVVGSTAALAATLLLIVHYGAGQRPLAHLIESCGAELKEMERKSREGLWSEVDADVARSTALQNLIDAARVSGSGSWLHQGDRSALAIVAVAAVSIVAFSMMSAADNDGDRQGSRVSEHGDPEVARLAIYARSIPPQDLFSGTINGAEKVLPDVSTMIERLIARLKSAPDDADGWRMLGWSYFHTQEPRKAAESYERAIALRPKSAELKVAYGEALVAAESGAVTAKAAEMFHSALQVDAANAKARYFLALAKAQAGNKREALDDWLAVQGELHDDEPWTAELRDRTKALAAELGVDVPSHIDPTAPSPDRAKIAKGDHIQPTSDDIRRIEALPPDQRQALIRGMVEALASRLQASPRDEEGWIRLVRSHVVLGEVPVARGTLKRALDTFADDEAARSRISAAAKELGITK